MALNKQGQFGFQHVNLSDTPQPGTYAPGEFKTKLDSQAQELRTTVNNVIDALVSTTDGASNIGTPAITTGGSTTVQGQLAYLKAQQDLKESSTSITTNRKLSPTGDFTGTLNGQSIASIGASPVEVVTARGGFVNLGARLDNAEIRVNPDVNVIDRGAKADGVTDDTAVIQTTIDYLAGKGGGVALFPSGTYKVSNLVLKTGVILRGVGSATRLVGKDANPVIKCGSPVAVGGWEGDCSFAGIENLRIDGNGTASHGLYLVFFTNTSHVRDVIITNCQIGTYIDKSWYANFTNVQMDYNLNIGLHVHGSSPSSEVNGVNFTNCYFKWNKNKGALLDGYGKGNMFVSCTFEGHESYGFEIREFMGGTTLDNCYFEKNGTTLPTLTHVYFLSDNEWEGSLMIEGGLFNCAGNSIPIVVDTAFSLTIRGAYFMEGATGAPLYTIRSKSQISIIEACVFNTGAVYDYFDVTSKRKVIVTQVPDALLEVTRNAAYGQAANTTMVFGAVAETAVDTGQVYQYKAFVEGDQTGQNLTLRGMRRGGTISDVFKVSEKNNILFYGAMDISSGSLDVFNSQAGYDMSSNAQITLGAMEETAVDPDRPYQYYFKTEGDSWNQNLRLAGKVRGGADVNLITITNKDEIIINGRVTFMNTPKLVLHELDMTYPIAYGNSPGANKIAIGSSVDTAVDAGVPYQYYITQTGNGEDQQFKVKAKLRGQADKEMLTISNKGMLTVPNGIASASNVRPIGPNIGTMIFDTNLNRPIWWNGTSWADAVGNVV